LKIDPLDLFQTRRHPVHGKQRFDAFDFGLFGIGFIHAVLDERPAVISREVLPVGEVLAGIHLVLLTHFAKLLITSFAEAVLHKIHRLP
jgi:hypothetical protein